MLPHLSTCLILCCCLPVTSLLPTEVVDELLSSSYNKHMRPGENLGSPTVVFVDMLVTSVSSISEANMDFTMMTFMRQTWRDARLADTRLNETTALAPSQFSKLWVPDLFVKNAKKSEFHDVTVPNRLLMLDENGTITYSQRLTLVVSCYMNLLKYPFDNQTCSIIVESYGYTTKDVVFRWKDLSEPIQIAEELRLPEFSISNKSTHDCTVSYVTGSFTCLEAKIYFKREYGYYMVQTFIPSGLIVVLSWVSFWIDIRAVPARISLGLLTVLTMTTHATGVSSALPRVSYIKAIDVWMATCLIFVFGALIEFAVVNLLDRKAQRKLEQDLLTDNMVPKMVKDRWVEALAMTTGNPTLVNKHKRVTQRQEENGVRRRQSHEDETEELNCMSICGKKVLKHKAFMVDFVSRIIFPVAFVIFNGLFWGVFYISGVK